MAWVTPALLAVWNSGDYVGENTPAAVVQVQAGQWIRGWYTASEVAFPPVSAQIWGEGSYGPVGAQVGHWSAKWVPSGAWIDLPNLSSIKKTKDLTAKGVTVLEVVLDAQDFVPKTGALGDAYHAIAPGWLAATRGYVSPTRANPGWATSGWEGTVVDSVKIRVWQGYGQPETVSTITPPVDGGTNGAWTYAGMIDDVDIDGNPNIITITARNGKLLTDQRVFRASKSVQLKDPITFYDSGASLQTKMVGSSPDASSHAVNFPARNVMDFPNNCFDVTAAAYATSWESLGNIDAGSLEWVEIRLPQGSYHDFWLVTLSEGDLAYVGIYAKQLEHWVENTTGPGLTAQTSPPTMDGAPLTFPGGALEGWVDFGNAAPGGNGGWPYTRTFVTGTTLAGYTNIDRPSLQHTFELGKHSILRVGFTRPSGAAGPAVVADLHGLHQFVTKEIVKEQFILIDDASEMVKVALRWAGYTQWDVETAGVRLSDGTKYGPGVVLQAAGRLMFNRSQYLIDIITTIAQQLGFIFFIADPVDANSDGIPTFRHDSSLLESNNYIAADLDASTMLTGLKVKVTDEDRPYIIRVRGKTASARQGGVPLGGDTITRIMAVYKPPWVNRCGGVLRHIVFQNDQLTTYAMCLYGCFLIALEAALAMHTAIAEIPAHPIIELDDQVGILDEPTGTNGRLWIIKAEDTMTLGQAASWKQTLSGALLDSQDFQEVIAQVTGLASFIIGTPTPPTFEATVNPPLDWSHVTDPDTGIVSGYRSPTITTPPAKSITTISGSTGRTLARTR